MSEGDHGPEPRSRGRAETWLSVLRQFSRLWGFALFLGFIVVLFRQIVLPFVFAIVLAYLLAPAVRRMQPRTGRAGAVIILYLVILSGLVGFFGLLLPGVVADLARLKETAPDAMAKIGQEWVPRASAWVDENFGSLVPAGPSQTPASQVTVVPQPDGSWLVELEDVHLSVEETADGGYLVQAPTHGGSSLGEVLEHLAAAKGTELTRLVGSAVQAAVAGVAKFLTSFVITFMLAAFILVDIDRVNRFVRSLVPVEYQASFDQIVRGIDVGMAGVIRGQLLICLVNGCLTYVGLLIFGVKYGLLLALVAGVFSLVPIFGTILSSIPIVLVALVSGDDGALATGKGLAMLAWIAGIHLLEANFLNPKIIGDSAHIHPVVVVFALLAGESAFGLTGALLAVPTASMIQTIFLFARSRSRELFERQKEQARAGALERGDDGREG
jgi:predicted PurR-regulated permease PerM